MEALVAYYRKYESETPDFRAVVKLEGDEIARADFEGRSTDAVVRDVPMPALAGRMTPGTRRELIFNRQGTGTLFYTARLRYASDQLYQKGLDSGFSIQRRYSPHTESGGDAPPSLTYKAGDLVKVTLSFDLTKERRFVAVTDLLPAGFEPVESWFATTASSFSRPDCRKDGTNLPTSSARRRRGRSAPRRRTWKRCTSPKCLAARKP